MNNLLNKQIFIVDDDPFWSSILHQILTELGYANILLYENGNDCMSNLHLNPDIIFLDYQMEGFDGLEVLKQIKSVNENIEVIFNTSIEDLNVAMNAITLGSFEYLLKGNATKKDVQKIIENTFNKKLQ